MDSPERNKAEVAAKAHQCAKDGCPALVDSGTACGWTLIEGKPIPLGEVEVCPLGWQERVKSMLL